MNIEEKLEEIWVKDYINTFSEVITKRKYCYAVNKEKKDILITGINPSFRHKESKNGKDSFDFNWIANDSKHDNYWSSLKRIVRNDNLNFLNRTGYLDIFFFREKDQNFLKREILKNTNGVKFLIDQLKLTQKIVENVIQPKVIIVKNKESAAYWGKYASDGMIWMGYNLELIQNSKFGEIYKINGLIKSNERISIDMENSNLVGSIILFTHHINQYTPKEKRPTPVLVNQLLFFYENGSFHSDFNFE